MRNFKYFIVFTSAPGVLPQQNDRYRIQPWKVNEIKAYKNMMWWRMKNVTYEGPSRSFVAELLKNPRRIRKIPNYFIRKRTTFTISPGNPYFFVNNYRAKTLASQYHCGRSKKLPFKFLNINSTATSLSCAANCWPPNSFFRLRNRW